MTYEHATIVITLSVASALRKLAQLLDRNETDGMFISELSATGNLPATHFVSSGKMPDVFIQAMKSPALLHTRGQAAFLAANIAYPYTLSQITAALAACSISDGTRTVLIDTVPTVVSEGPHAFIARLGLKMIQGTP